jgi:hypothetical protein
MTVDKQVQEFFVLQLAVKRSKIILEREDLRSFCTKSIFSHLTLWTSRLSNNENMRTSSSFLYLIRKPDGESTYKTMY